MDRWDGWGHLKSFLIKKPRNRTSIDFWASSRAICVSHECMHVHTHSPLPCAEILAPPLSGEKGWRLNLEEGVSCQEGGWGGAVPEMTNLPSLFHFSPRTLESPGSPESCLPTYPSLSAPFPLWGMIGNGSPQSGQTRGVFRRRGWDLISLPSFPLLPPTKLPPPQGRVVGTGGIFPTPSPPSVFL